MSIHHHEWTQRKMFYAERHFLWPLANLLVIATDYSQNVSGSGHFLQCISQKTFFAVHLVNVFSSMIKMATLFTIFPHSFWKWNSAHLKAKKIVFPKPGTYQVRGMQVLYAGGYIEGTSEPPTIDENGPDGWTLEITENGCQDLTDYDDDDNNKSSSAAATTAVLWMGLKTSLVWVFLVAANFMAAP